MMTNKELRLKYDLAVEKANKPPVEAKEAKSTAEGDLNAANAEVERLGQSLAQKANIEVHDSKDLATIKVLKEKTGWNGTVVLKPSHDHARAALVEEAEAAGLNIFHS